MLQPRFRLAATCFRFLLCFAISLKPPEGSLPAFAIDSRHDTIFITPHYYFHIRRTISRRLRRERAAFIISHTPATDNITWLYLLIGRRLRHTSFQAVIFTGHSYQSFRRRQPALSAWPSIFHTALPALRLSRRYRRQDCFFSRLRHCHASQMASHDFQPPPPRHGRHCRMP